MVFPFSVKAERIRENRSIENGSCEEGRFESEGSVEGSPEGRTQSEAESEATEEGSVGECNARGEHGVGHGEGGLIGERDAQSLGEPQEYREEDEESAALYYVGEGETKHREGKE